MLTIGVDLGGTTIKLGLVNGRDIVATKKILADADLNFASKLPAIRSAVDQLLADHRINPQQLEGIGLAFPSVVNSKRRKILSHYVKFSDADKVDLVQWAREHWSVPLALENDARAALVGEWQYGSGQGYSHVVMITLGTGVGSGVLLDGKLVRGAHHVGGNLGGHTIINLNGSTCNCGIRGCVESEASGWSVHEKFARDPLYPQSLLSQRGDINYQAVFQSAADGDAFATKIRDHSRHVWAVNALNFVHHFDPEVLILGGGIMKSADQIMPYVQDFIDENAWQPAGSIKVVAAKEHNYAGVLGMSYLAGREVVS